MGRSFAGVMQNGAMRNDRPSFRVLGSMEVGHPDRPIALVGARQRSLLAVLLAARGATVPVDALVDLLWGDDPPDNPPAALYSHVSRLRRSIAELLVGDCDLVTRPPGYALVVPDQVDSVRFERLVDEARAADGDLERYDEALHLWRGSPYSEFTDLEPVHVEAIRLGELHSAVVEERAEALLRSGRADLVVPELESFVAGQPLRESARAALMRALYATGRHADALRHYQEYRRHLADELGLEPSASLRRLEQRILTHDVPSPAATRSSSGATDSTSLEALQIRYLRTASGRSIATATAGSGPPLVVVPAWVTSLDVIAAGRDPRSSLIERLLRHACVTLYDRAGTGLSGGTVDDFSVGASADELITVLERLGGGTLLAVSQGGPGAVLAAARRPDLVTGLVLFGTYADAAGVFTKPSRNQALVDLTRADFGMGAKLLADLYRPGASVQAGEHLARVLRDSAPASVGAGYLEETYRADVTPVLGHVAQPALLLHYRGDRVIPFVGGKQLAAGLPNARLVALDGTFHLPDAADLPRIVDLITAFLSDATASSTDR